MTAVYRASGRYKHGAVTVFGLNVSPTDTAYLDFGESPLLEQPVDVYILSPYDGILSKYAVLSIYNFYTPVIEARKSSSVTSILCSYRWHEIIHHSSFCDIFTKFLQPHIASPRHCSVWPHHSLFIFCHLHSFLTYFVPSWMLNLISINQQVALTCLPTSSSLYITVCSFQRTLPCL